MDMEICGILEIVIKNEGPEDKDIQITDYVPFAAVIRDPE